MCRNAFAACDLFNPAVLCCDKLFLTVQPQFGQCFSDELILASLALCFIIVFSTFLDSRGPDPFATIN